MGVNFPNVNWTELASFIVVVSAAIVVLRRIADYTNTKKEIVTLKRRIEHLEKRLNRQSKMLQKLDFLNKVALAKIEVPEENNNGIIDAASPHRR